MSTSNIIAIPRGVPFRIEFFLGMGWSLAEEDPRSLALSEIDINKICIVNVLTKEDGGGASGEEMFRRIRALKDISLVAQVFQTLWDNPEIIPQTWKERTPDIGRPGLPTMIYFPGTICIAGNIDRCLLFLNWHNESEWRFGVGWLGQDLAIGDVFAALKQ